MSFVVEIPSIFTKPTQIPVRLGNTILSGNETIQGALQVNGSLTLNVGSNVDNTNTVYYDSLDISNALSVGGNATIGGLITSPNFKVTTVAENYNSLVFDSGATNVQTLQTDLSNGNGHLILMLSLRAFITATGGITVTINYEDISDNVLFTTSRICHSNEANIVQTFTFFINMGKIASGTGRKITLTRSDTNFRMNTNTRTDCILVELPF
ncbi:MAG: hypothetical protein ACO3HJ_04250 [Methylophilaceae bacterium]